MATIPVGFYNAEFIYNVAGSPRDVTFGLGIDNTGSPGITPTDVAQEMYNAATFTGSIAVATTILTGWTFQGVSVTYQDEEGPLVGQFISPKVGSSPGTCVPVNCSVLVAKNTNSGGRRNRGRMYYPPLQAAENNVDNVGVISPGTVTIMQGYFNVFHAQILLAEFQPVLFHQSAPFTPTPVTGFSVKDLLATQRRRMRG